MKEEGWYRCQELLESCDPAFVAACALRPELIDELDVEGLFFHMDRQAFHNASSWEELAVQAGQPVYPYTWKVSHLYPRMQAVARQLRTMVPPEIVWGDEGDVFRVFSVDVYGRGMRFRLSEDAWGRLLQDPVWDRIGIMLVARGLPLLQLSDGAIILMSKYA